MLKLLILILFSFISTLILSQECQNQREIFSFKDQSCQQCDASCDSCSGISQFECISCKQDLFRLKNNNLCSNQCQKGMYQDLNSMSCDYCSIFGCSKCTIEQKCLECYENLELDPVQGQCKIKQDFCLEEQIYSLKEKKCTYFCESNYILSENNKLCLPLQNCKQIIEFSSIDRTEFLYNASIMSNNKILLQANQCSFYVLDENFDIFFFLQLQPDKINMNVNSSKYYNYFIQGDIGGCFNLERTIAYNFVKNKIEFIIEGKLNIKYSLYLLVTKFHLAILGDISLDGYMIYDYEQQISLLTKNNQFMSQIKLINQSNSIFLIEEIDQIAKIYSKYILVLNQYLYYKFGLELSSYSKGFSCLNEEDNTFIVVDQTSLYIYQLIQGFSQVKELLSINKLETDLQLFVYSEKNIITITSEQANIIYVYQYSILDNTLNLLMTIKDQYQQYRFLIYYMKNENNQINLIVFFNWVSISLFTIDDYSKNNGEYELSSNLQFNFEIDYIIPFINRIDDENENQNKMDFIFFTGNQFQIYKQSILIKNNKIEASKYSRLRKKINHFFFGEIKNLKSIQGVGEFYETSFINIEKQSNRVSYLDIKINLQTLNISKIQSKELFKRPLIQARIRFKWLVENTYIYVQRTHNMKCNNYLIDISTNQILFYFKSDCISEQDFYFIKRRKLLFAKPLYALYNIDTKQRILSFSETDQKKYASSLICVIYKDEKLLLSDISGNFFAFDFVNLQFQQFINDQTVKVTKFQLIDKRPINQDKNEQYLLNINDSVYVEINEIYLQEFSFSSNRLNQNQKIEISQYKTVETIKYKTFTFDNQIFFLTENALQIYSQNLNFIDSITLQNDQYRIQFFLLQDQFLFFYGEKKLYRLDMNSKQIQSLQSVKIDIKVSFIDSTMNILIFESYAIQYQKMVLLKTFLNTKYFTMFQVLLNMYLNSILIQYANNQISYVANIENKPVIQTSFKSDQQIISTFISSNIQVAYYFDANKKQIIKHNIVSKTIDRIYSFTDPYIYLYADYYSDIFIYTQLDGSLKVFDPNKISQQINFIQKFSGINRVQFCFNLSLAIVQTSINEIILFYVKKFLLQFCYNFKIIYFQKPSVQKIRSQQDQFRFE